jgi:DNA-binding transcriptional LysR family regulator
MQLQTVRYFLALCEEHSFIRAARRCGVSQPSLSNAIKRLEDQLGGTLFIRAVRPEHETLPTALAIAIKRPLEQALANVELAKDIASHAAGSMATRRARRRGASGPRRYL